MGKLKKSLITNNKITIKNTTTQLSKMQDNNTNNNQEKSTFDTVKDTVTNKVEDAKNFVSEKFEKSPEEKNEENIQGMKDGPSNTYDNAKEFAERKFEQTKEKVTGKEGDSK